MKQARNEKCDCGSGRKYKNCCAGNSASKTPVIIGGVAALAAVVAAGGYLYSGRGEQAAPVVESSAASTPAPVPSPPPAGTTLVPVETSTTEAPLVAGASDKAVTKPAGVPQPPGPPPAGKVWSPSHGHWHDIESRTGGPASQLVMQTTTAPAPPKAAPPGPAPAGKVWSAEHGHWHDIETAINSAPRPAAPAAPVTAAAAPQGTAPAGKVWSAEHGHYHDAPKPGISNLRIGGVPVEIAAQKLGIDETTTSTAPATTSTAPKP